MPQLHLYVPDEVADRLRQRAEERNLSLSRYLAEIVQKEVSPCWPDGYFEGVYGGWHGGFERPDQPIPEDRLTLDSDPRS